MLVAALITPLALEATTRQSWPWTGERLSGGLRRQIGAEVRRRLEAGSSLRAPGIAALLTGRSGTGKTLAAEIPG